MQSPPRWHPSNDELMIRRRQLRQTEEEGSGNIYEEPHANTEHSSSSPLEREYYNQSAIFRHQEPQQTSGASATIHTENAEEEEGSGNIYEEPHASTEHSLPPPVEREYYNQSAFLRHQESQQTSGTSATVHTEYTGYHTEEEGSGNIYDEPHASTYDRSAIVQSEYGTVASTMASMPLLHARRKPVPPPKPRRSTTTYNTGNRCFSSTGSPIYDQPNTSMECSSPPPTDPGYYNYRAIWNQQSQYGPQASAMVLESSRTKPTPPPKPKRPTRDHKHTDDASTSLQTYQTDWSSNPDVQARQIQH